MQANDLEKNKPKINMNFCRMYPRQIERGRMPVLWNEWENQSPKAELQTNNISQQSKEYDFLHDIYMTSKFL